MGGDISPPGRMGSGGQAHSLDLPFYRDLQEGKKDTFSECLKDAGTKTDTLTHFGLSNVTTLRGLTRPTFQPRQREQRD